MRKQSQNDLLILCFVIFILTIIFAFYFPDGQVELYFWNYVIDGILGIVCITLFGFNAIKRKYDLFSPITILSILHITMFFFTPMYDIVIGNTSWYGVNLFPYGIEGSLIAFFAYISFLIAYNVSYTPSHTKHYFMEKDEKSIPLILIMYAICLLANVYYLVKVSGNSVTYIFTLGLLGTGDSSEASDASLGFISMLSFALPSITLLYVEYGKSKLLKIILFALMFVLQVERGFRFYIIQIIIMFAAYYFIRHNKKPKFSQLAFGGMLMMIPIVLMTMFRNSIRVGGGMDLSLVDLNSITDALDAAIWDNFRIYKTYYGIIKAVPNMTDYMYGQQMIKYTIIMFIPRMIWPGKPAPPGSEAIALGVTEYSVKAGTAYPNIGEYYYEFGVPGVIFFMVLLARLLKMTYVKYRERCSSKIELMIYCTVLGDILQLVIRGYTPSNFWMVVFTLLPYLVILMISG